MDAGPTDETWWRCENCRRRWHTDGKANDALPIAWLRRRARRRARKTESIPSAWAARAGSTRCPSCLSTQIRLSRQQGTTVRPPRTPTTPPPPRHRRYVRYGLGTVGVVVLVLVGLAAFRLVEAARAGHRGQQALLDAVTLMTPRDGFGALDAATLDRARQRLADARADFAEMHHDLAGAGPAYSVARYVPFVRVQVRGVDALSDTGSELTAAALQLTAAARSFVAPGDGRTTLANGNVLPQLRTIERSTQDAATVLQSAIDHLSTLNGYRLIGPLGSARDALVERLPDLEKRTLSARDAVRAFISFAGGDGPRHYLVLTQNPDEVRPTGGYIGTYGSLSADGGNVHVQQFGDTSAWIAAHPGAVVPESAAPAVFKVISSNQTLANVNASPDWPTAAQLAMKLWREGGEPSVDGVVSFTPDFLARVVAVLGPIQVPQYGDTVTGQNLVERTDYWTHHAPAQPVAGGRKEFLSVLAPRVMHRLVAAPATQWPKLAAAVADGFATQQAMMWVQQPGVQDVVGAHQWDFRLPETLGDFYADTEFEFAAKNGRGLRRTFDHTVTLHPDGSAQVSTVMTLHNTQPFDGVYNATSGGYLTPYGPAGATLSDQSDPPDWNAEPDVNGHPTAGWERDAPPGGTTTLHVVWDVDELLTPTRDGDYVYSLTWVPSPGHAGDLLHLHVTLPDGWSWVGAAPPATVRVNKLAHGEWLLKKSS